MRQVLAGLSYAHQRLIVHRDIKPGNVLVTPEGRVKLLDFGIAKLLGAEIGGDALLTQMGRAATPAYAPPEQLAGGAITVAADIYSGPACLLFELCTGARPFVDAPLAEGAPIGFQPAAHTHLTRQAWPIRVICRGNCVAISTPSSPVRCRPIPPRATLSATAFDDDLQRWQRGAAGAARGASVG